MVRFKCVGKGKVYDMDKIGFDNEQYLRTQSEHIKERIAKFGGKLYLEFGGKLFDELSFLPTDFNDFFKELYSYFLEGEETIFPESEHTQKSAYSLKDRVLQWNSGEFYDFLDKKRYSAFLAWQNDIEEKNKDFSLWRALFQKQDHFPCSTFIHLSPGKKEEWEKTLPALFRYYFFRKKHGNAKKLRLFGKKAGKLGSLLF